MENDSEKQDYDEIQKIKNALELADKAGVDIVLAREQLHLLLNGIPVYHLEIERPPTNKDFLFLVKFWKEGWAWVTGILWEDDRITVNGYHSSPTQITHDMVVCWTKLPKIIKEIRWD